MAEEEVESNPVQVENSPPVSTASKPRMKPLRTRVVVHNNLAPVPIECFQPPDSGSCGKDTVRVYYDHETRTCKLFSFTGCGGNANRFLSVKNCYQICHPYRYEVNPVVASVRKPAILSAPRPAVLVEPAAPPPRPQVRIVERQVPLMAAPPKPRMAMVPVSSYQSIPVRSIPVRSIPVQSTPFQSVPIMRSGYMAVPVNYGGFTRGFGLGDRVKPGL